MLNLKAIYRHGLFEPLEPVSLDEEQCVRLNVEVIPDETVQSWIQRVRLVHTPIVQRQGPLPDSSREIAADRLR